jgi:hypothetical protein
MTYKDCGICGKPKTHALSFGGSKKKTHVPPPPQLITHLWNDKGKFTPTVYPQKTPSLYQTNEMAISHDG